MKPKTSEGKGIKENIIIIIFFILFVISIYFLIKPLFTLDCQTLKTHWLYKNSYSLNRCN